MFIYFPAKSAAKKNRPLIARVNLNKKKTLLTSCTPPSCCCANASSIPSNWSSVFVIVPRYSCVSRYTLREKDCDNCHVERSLNVGYGDTALLLDHDTTFPYGNISNYRPNWNNATNWAILVTCSDDRAAETLRVINH